METTKVFFRLVLGLSLLAVITAQPLPTKIYTYSQEFFNDAIFGQYFKLYWNVDRANDKIEYAMVCEQDDPGWCAVGWSVDGYMIGADSVIGSINSTNHPLIYDFKLNSQVPPSNGTCPAGVCADSIIPGCADQVTAISGRREGRYMVLEFTRPISASDSCDNAVELDTQTQYVIMAWGLGYAPNGILRHGVSGNNNFTQILWNPVVLSTGGITSNSLTSGVVATTGLDPVTSGSATTGLQAVTTGLQPAVTSGSGVVVTTAAEGDGVESESSGIFGLEIWQFALIIVAAVLVLAAIIVAIVLVAKRGKKKEYFGGFY